jgi:hypothetical protein
MPYRQQLTLSQLRHCNRISGIYGFGWPRNSIDNVMASSWPRTFVSWSVCISDPPPPLWTGFRTDVPKAAGTNLPTLSTLRPWDCHEYRMGAGDSCSYSVRFYVNRKGITNLSSGMIPRNPLEVYNASQRHNLHLQGWRKTKQWTGMKQVACRETPVDLQRIAARAFWGTNGVYTTLPSPEDGTRSSSLNIMFSSYLESRRWTKHIPFA